MSYTRVQYIPRNMHTVFALPCFVVVIHWLIFPHPSGLLHWHCDNLTIAPVPAKQPWWIWINTSCEFIVNDCITTTKQSTTKPCAYFLGYTVDDINSNLLTSCYLHQTRVIIRRLWCGGFNVCYQLRFYVLGISWWHHLMETKSALLVLCAGNSPVTSGFLSQRSVRRSFDAFFELHLNKRLSKQSWGWWFETPLCSSWRHCHITNIVTLFSTVRCRHNTVQFNTS